MPRSDFELEYKEALQYSLLQGTPMQSFPPDALDFSRDGRWLYTHGLDSSTGDYYLMQFSVGERLAPGSLELHVKDLFSPYVSVSSDGTECLTLSQYVSPGGVRDVIYRASTEIPEQDFGHRSGVPYERIAGFPADGNETVFQSIKPFYSWDSKTIIVPFNKLGLGVIDRNSGTGSYNAYPEETSGAQGMAFGPLPDYEESRSIWASFWQTGALEDACRIYTLDLATGQWQRRFELPWTVFQVAVKDPDFDPWLVSGSRPADEGADPAAGGLSGGRRVPRLAYLTPGEGSVDLIETGGEPAWQIALEPLGSHVLFMDSARRGLVRMNMESGAVDIDTRWYSGTDDTQLFIGTGGERCYAWWRDILLQAEWSGHDKVDLPGAE